MIFFFVYVYWTLSNEGCFIIVRQHFALTVSILMPIQVKLDTGGSSWSLLHIVEISHKYK